LVEELDKRVEKIKGSSEDLEASRLIEEYKPFILKVVTEAKNGYVDLDNDEEFSIALVAFKEAMDRYELDQGRFLTFAGLVIRSRLKNYWESSKSDTYASLDLEIEDKDSMEDAALLRIEIQSFEKSLQRFGITFDDLVDKAPKHRDTLQKAKELGMKSAQDEEIVSHLYTKRRLPVAMVSRKFFVSPKVVKGSKIFIISIIVVVKEGFENIFSWISE